MIKIKGIFFWLLMMFFWPFFILGYTMDVAKKEGLSTKDMPISIWLESLFFFAVNTSIYVLGILYAIEKIS